MQCSLCTNVAHRVVKVRGKDVGFCNLDSHKEAAFAAAAKTVPQASFSARNEFDWQTKKTTTKGRVKTYSDIPHHTL